MAEIINIQDYRRTCDNCEYWVPPIKRGKQIIKDGRCRRPGGWTQKWIGPPGPYQRLECKSFKRRDKNVKI